MSKTQSGDYHDGEPASTALSPAAHAAGDRMGQGRGELILVADDDAAIRTLVVLVLCQNGYRTVAAENGAEAVRMFSALKNEVVAVILDMFMPVMNGDEAMLAMRKIIPGLPVLRISGEMPAGSFSADGRTAFMMKPLAAEVLLASLRSLVDCQAEAFAGGAKVQHNASINT